MIIQNLEKAGLIHPPKFLSDNTQYLVMMGSEAYGVSSNSSDIDLYGFCIPPKHVLFPHLNGYIDGFGQQPKKFEQWSEHHIQFNAKEYDATVYNITKYASLCADNNPNMIDSLFVPDRCVLHVTKCGAHMRDNRKLFLHKGSFHKFRGYAYAQIKKIKDKTNSSNPKRAALIEQFGYDTKFAYHIVRLALEAEQILVDHDLSIDSSREVLKSVRRGEWTLDYLLEWFEKKNLRLEELYNTSKLRSHPDYVVLKKVLVECLEMHYGALSELIKVRNEDSDSKLLGEISALLKNNGY